MYYTLSLSLPLPLYILFVFFLPGPSAPSPSFSFSIVPNGEPIYVHSKSKKKMMEGAVPRQPAISLQFSVVGMTHM
ncbi:hypothetical protein BDB00DRAFT_537486 [Zychaea mexicana]|uniref:uncharacterized protein n=1 Tax=Zychaea mexicana TaxID=64656 RepID=UPI0022FF0F8C|nr:uncharacterized protein BDB00DRAFT_537486 [Zychaea mexicana]KAI9490565.1 hypothetical protein BDB00DRAFT_537486 [Zychaea mexicana]